jgi:hypothetical protein
MTDQIEKWRDEFKSIMKKERPLNSLARLPDDSAYIDRDTFYLEQGFLIAKRNMPVVELPKPELCFTSSTSGHGSFAYVQLEPLIEALEKAGIEWISENPYPVKGE